MDILSLLTSNEVQHNLAQAVQTKRKAAKLSRDALAERSTVPSPTIKKFELTGQISLRQFILLWQSLDSLDRLNQLTTPTPVTPQSIEEVLKS